MTTTCDVLIVGGGVVGLWTAHLAAKAGLKTILVDREQCGSGGSGGVLGALLPHLPNAMNAKNRFQFEALVELPDLINSLEDETGIATGYVRCGRAMPVRHEGFLKTVELCQNKSSENWRHNKGIFNFELVSPDRLEGWIEPEKAPLGLAWDNLAAKITPRDYLSALKSCVLKHASIIEGFEVRDIDQASGQVKSSDGRVVQAENIVLSAGYQSYDLLENLTGIAFGGGIKGQAALFKLPLQEQKPVLYDDGMYIVHHAPDKCAVGSTTEPDWKPPIQPDEAKTQKFLDKAMALCPPLRQAEPLGLWAGIRPKSRAKDPMIGRVSPGSRVLMATGGFKISFGIAHRLAQYLIVELTNSSEKIDLPETYKMSHHVSCGMDTGRISDTQKEQFQE